MFLRPAGRDHEAEAGQGPQEDPGAQGEVATGREGEGQIQGGNHREDAGVKAPLLTIKTVEFHLLSRLLYLGLRCADSTLPLPGTQVCRLHPPFTWDSGVQTPPSLYLGLRCADSTLPLPGTQVCRLHPPFTWDSGVQTPPSLYLGLRCADSTLPLPGTQVCRLHPPFTWDSGVQTPPSLYAKIFLQ